MLQKLRKRTEGFTIIEVLIVLAIAGLILLIVFLAVPALQRNSRNTQRKNDASAIAGAVANFISNNGGTLPKGVKVNASDTNSVDICAVADCSSGNKETAKLGYYDPSGTNIKLVISKAATDADVKDRTKDTLTIDTGYNCNKDNTDVGTATSRTAAIKYAVESSSSTVSQQCVEQ